MSLKNVSKDLGEIHSRLFDHRPVVLGEINYFVREFEEKRHDREVVRLQQSLEHMQELSKSLIPQAKSDLECSLTPLKAKLSTAIEMSEMVLEQENNEQQVWLKGVREKRVKQWTEFMDDMCEESKKVDKQFEEELAAVENYFKEIEEKLKVGKS